MTQDEIIAMANTAAVQHGHTYEPEAADGTIEFLGSFAALVAAKEREACAQVCDASVEEWLRLDGSHHELTEAQMLADEIRARGQKDAA